MPMVYVKLPHTSYPIAIGEGEKARLRSLVRKHASSGRVFCICDPQVYALHGARIVGELNLPEEDLFVLPQGEAAKSETVLTGVYDYLIARKIVRSDFILACGGGVTTDLTGYAAATILRGIRWGAVPTTLLGMVDAAIGGKTGINHHRGKNLVGAIWQPAFVSSDLRFLHTLPRREMVAGCGELLKYAGLMGAPVPGKLSRYLAGNLWDTSRLLPLIRLSVEYKSEIVTRDERETGIRAFLNFGHTFGHAIEQSLGYGKLLHGESVILGLRAALALSARVKAGSGRLNQSYQTLVDEAIALVRRKPLSAEAVVDAMALDKKRISDGLRFVLLERPGKPYLASGVKKQYVTEAVEEMLAIYKQQGGSHAANSGR